MSGSVFKKEVLKEGSGPAPSQGTRVTVHCTGWDDEGRKFWSTHDPGQQPFAFEVGMGRVIKGWDRGVLSMKKGEVAQLTCPPADAYGPGGFPAWGIKPNATLTFEIEVIDF